MPLQVAACPRCRSALVFGEQRCVACGQTFQYGATPPPAPTPQQIAEALAAAGAPPRPLASAQASLEQAVAARTQPPPQQPSSSPSAAAPKSVAVMDGLDTGRFEDVGEVELVHVSGLINADLFKALTPKDVDAPPIAGLDQGRFEDVAVRADTVPDVERTVRDDVDALPVPPVSGLFGSNIYDTHGVEVAPPPVDGIERVSDVRVKAPAGASLTGGSPPAKGAKDTRTQAQKDAALPKVVCRCGETHRLPRCPACGTPHPERA